MDNSLHSRTARIPTMSTKINKIQKYSPTVKNKTPYMARIPTASPYRASSAERDDVRSEPIDNEDGLTPININTSPRKLPSRFFDAHSPQSRLSLSRGSSTNRAKSMPGSA